MSYRTASIFQIRMAIVWVTAFILFSVVGLFAQDKQAFRGEICLGVTGRVPDCSAGAAKEGAVYVLSDKKNNAVYLLDEQTRPPIFEAHDVVILGTLNKATSTIHVNNIVRDVPARVKQAKTVSIVCDACPRNMAKARKAAFEEMSGWKRFTVVPDPKKADLILLLSANRYLGDYLTRDGADKRPVQVATTYLNVLDPHTGQSLWGDSERLGSWLVTESTKDLIDHLRELVEVDENPAERELFLKQNWVAKPIMATDGGK
jgi:hypothetical protein